jgi:cell division protein ZapA (FtsZ GTPase activity inhibitor)
MARFENRLKIGLNEGKLEVLKGREGDVFEGVSFKYFQNAKQQPIFKSSSPDRKIIVLSPFSEIPEEGEPSRVLILEDTDPDNPMDGKMIGTIISKDQRIADTRSLAIQTRGEYKKQKNKDVLTPETREQIGSLVEVCINESIWDDPRYNNDDYENEPGAEEERYLNQKVIGLRRRIRAEGPKIISYILEQTRGNNHDVSRLYCYTRLLDFAATAQDGKKVMEVFNRDTFAKGMARVTKEEAMSIMSRIASVNDIDSIKKFFDKTLQSPYVRFTADYHRNDADMILLSLHELKARTKSAADIQKIEGVIEYIANKINELGLQTSRIIPDGPEKINTQFEEKFLDIELKNKMHGFSDYWENFKSDGEDDHGDNVLDAAEEMVIECQEVLARHHASDKFPDLVKNAYWTLLNRGCVDASNPIYSEMILMLVAHSGIEVDYTAMDYKIQTWYENLTEAGIFGRNANVAREIHRRTGILFRLKPELAQKKFFELATGRRIDGPEAAAVLREITGITPDFRSVEGEIQRKYQGLILNSPEYEPDAFYSRPGLKEAEKLFELTGIRPVIDSEHMQEKYRSWLRGSHDYVKVVVAAERLTGITPNLQGYETLIQDTYLQLAISLSGTLADEILLKKIADFKKATHIEPVFDTEKIRSFYFIKILNGAENIISPIQELTGVMPDYTAFELRAHDRYLSLLTNFTQSYFDHTLQRIKKITTLTGLKPAFSRAEEITIVNYAVQALRPGNRISDAFRILEIIPSPKVHEQILQEIVNQAIDVSDSKSLAFGIEKMKELGMTPNSEEIIRILRSTISSNPRKIVSTLKFLKSEMKEGDFVWHIHERLSQDPWLSFFSKLERLQGVAANVTNDPWQTEFKPFLDAMLKRQIISIDRPEDAEILLSFIESMGMNNLPQLFMVYADCHRHRDFVGISGDSIALCESFGVRARRTDGSWRFKSSLELFNELGKALKNLQTDLLSDALPPGLKTELGSELFSRMKGSTQFERRHDLTSIIREWSNTIEDNPGIGKLPPGFKESTIKVPLLKHKIEADKDQTEQLDKLVRSQEVVDVYQPLAEAWKMGSSELLEDLIPELKFRIANEINDLATLLKASDSDLQLMIASETDAKKKENLMKKSKALKNPKARQAIEKQSDTLKKAAEEVDRLVALVERESELNEEKHVEILEALNVLDGKIPLSKEIRDISAMHMYDFLLNNEQKEMVDELFSKTPTPENIYAVHKISKDYIEEHYLHHTQSASHIEHTPFSPALLEKLNLVWQQQLDKETGYLPITFLKNKLDKILGLYEGKSKKEISISMVPVSGLFHIYSGDLGDSCHSSQHHEIATGEFPNLRSWIYVTNRGKQNEELRGSVLAIQAEQNNGTPVLVFRANNPSENFIQSVEADAFVLAGLREAVETAKRARTERIQNNPSLSAAQKRQIVTIPSGSKGAASTNRQAVADVYRKRFTGCQKISLKYTQETEFNGYDVHSASSSTAPLVVWYMDEDGKEAWFGDWKQ